MEANSCPKVVVANIDTKPFLHKQTVHVKHVSDRGLGDGMGWGSLILILILIHV